LTSVAKFPNLSLCGQIFAVPANKGGQLEPFASQNSRC
jgi:hypothetical protein